MNTYHRINVHPCFNGRCCEVFFDSKDNTLTITEKYNTLGYINLEELFDEISVKRGPEEMDQQLAAKILRSIKPCAEPSSFKPNLNQLEAAIDLGVYALARWNLIKKTVDVDPIAHAKWEEKAIYHEGAIGTGEIVAEHRVYCSRCKNHRKAPTNYCPDCGAKMDRLD